MKRAERLHDLVAVQGQTPPQVFVRPEDDNKPLPKIVLAQSPGGRSPPMNRAGSGGPSSPPPQVANHRQRLAHNQLLR